MIPAWAIILSIQEEKLTPQELLVWLDTPEAECIPHNPRLKLKTHIKEGTYDAQ